jgi:hypothetical protein
VFPELFTDNRKHRNLISDKSNILLQLIDIDDKFSRRSTVPVSAKVLQGASGGYQTGVPCGLRITEGMAA